MIYMLTVTGHHALCVNNRLFDNFDILSVHTIFLRIIVLKGGKLTLYCRWEKKTKHFFNLCKSVVIPIKC